MVGRWHIVIEGEPLCGVRVPDHAPTSSGRHGPPVLAPVCRECLSLFVQ